ncbi:MAG: DoxX family protein [Acidobacteria bacterium]|nr:DoxX family protein [Acidobacteriota bacterium]
MRIIRLIGTWILQLLLAAGFMAVGIGKFADTGWPARFARWGYPDGFYMVVGALEVVGAIGLLVPRLASYAAGLLMAVMTAAAITHLVHGETRQVTSPAVLLVLLTVVWWLRRSRGTRRSGATGAPLPASVLNPNAARNNRREADVV